MAYWKNNIHSLTKEMLKKSVCMKNLALGPHGAASKPRFKGFCYCCLLFSFCFLTHKLSFSRFRALGFSLISFRNFIFDGFLFVDLRIARLIFWWILSFSFFRLTTKPQRVDLGPPRRRTELFPLKTVCAVSPLSELVVFVT